MAILLWCQLTISTQVLAQADGRADAEYRTAMAAAVRAAANRVLPAVVTIEIIGAAGEVKGEVEQDAPTSGVIVDESGFILGSSIVVRRPSASILVVLADGTRHAAEVVARDHHRDLVLLKIDPKQPLVAINLGTSASTQIGETTIAVGRYGVNAAPMVSRGVLSAIDRLDGIALQTDARVSPALYGGPLIDLHGEVLGVLIPAVAEGGAPDATSWYDSGIAFAVPAEVIARKLDRLREGEDIKKGLIGIVSKSKDPYADGTTVAAVRTRSPAEAAGIKPGDQVREVDGVAVRRHQEIRQVLGRFDAGESIGILLDRGDEELKVEVTLAETIPPLQPQRLGVLVRPAGDEDMAKGQETPRGVEVVHVLPGSAADKNLRAGDLLTRVGNATVPDAETLRRLMISAEPDRELEVAVEREGQEQTIAITPQSIAGKIFSGVPASWNQGDKEAWQVEPLKLPDVGNEAAVLQPPEDDLRTRLGLMILLLNPGEGNPQGALKKWSESARDLGVVICAIAPEDNGRWQPKELDVVGRFAAAVLKKHPIDESAVSVASPGALAGGKAEAADSMALAVAVSQSNTFFGVAVSPKTRPPAVRVRENEASASMQLLLPIESESDLPAWTGALRSGGYPIVVGGKVDREVLLRWTRLLQAI